MEALPYSHLYRVADLAARKPTTFDLAPPADQLARIAADVGADAVRKLRFAGELVPLGSRDWQLTAKLGATVVQPCVVTLAPVTTRIDEVVVRKFLQHVPVPLETEVEVPEDDTIEPLGPVIDVGAVMAEALALALPLYPRAKGVEFGEATFAEPGAAPMETKIFPFASLRDKLGGTGEDS